jgi:alpha-L-fucosidase
MKMKNGSLVLKLLFTISMLIAQTMQAADANTKPDWTSLKCGLFVHWGLATCLGVPYQVARTNGIPGGRFAPTGLDARQWAQVARQSGMTFAVLTAKHEDGFCLWPSTKSDYTVAQSPFQHDVLAEFISACQTEGIMPGIQYSIPDVHDEGGFYPRNPVGAPYFSMIKEQLIELGTKYPGLKILILDGCGRFSPAQFSELRETLAVFNPQCYLAGDLKPFPWGETFICDTVNVGWFWMPGEKLTPAGKLYAGYAKAQTKNWPFILNAGPDKNGRIPDELVARLMEFKKLVDNPLAPVAPAPAAAPAAKPDAAERLKQVKSLYDQGLINKDDYDKKVKEIMDSL